MLQVVIGDGMNLPPLTRISCVAPGRYIGNYLENISFSDNAENPDQSMYLYSGYEFTYYEFQIAASSVSFAMRSILNDAKILQQKVAT